MLLLLLFGLLLFRFAQRRLLSLLFHAPPRSTLDSACPYAERSALQPTALRLVSATLFAFPSADQPP